MLNIRWNITQKLHPTLKPSNHKQLRKNTHVFRAKNIFLRGGRWSEWGTAHAVPKRCTLTFCAHVLHVHPETWPPRGLSFPLNIFGRTYSTYVYVHKCIEEECGIINESGSCTLRPTRLLACCFPLHRRQISSDITCSPLSSTATNK